MDIHEMIVNEIPDAEDIDDLIRERIKINNWKAELEERRKEIDSCVSDFLTEHELNELTSSSYTVTTVKSKGSGRWNKNELVKILSPLQLEKTYSEGKPFKYIKVTQKTNE